MGLKNQIEVWKRQKKLKTSIKPPCALHAHNGARRALGQCIRARASLFCAKIMRRRRSSWTLRSSGSVFSDNFCATRVGPWYLYETSLKLFGFVLLHKVPKEKTARQWFWKFSAQCKFSGHRLAETVTSIDCGDLRKFRYVSTFFVDIFTWSLNISAISWIYIQIPLINIFRKFRIYILFLLYLKIFMAHVGYEQIHTTICS